MEAYSRSQIFVITWKYHWSDQMGFSWNSTKNQLCLDATLPSFFHRCIDVWEVQSINNELSVTLMKVNRAIFQANTCNNTVCHINCTFTRYNFFTNCKSYLLYLGLNTLKILEYFRDGQASFKGPVFPASLWSILRCIDGIMFGLGCLKQHRIN